MSTTKIDPGAGYRLLEPHEILQSEDQYFAQIGKDSGWCLTGDAGLPVSYNAILTYRRPVVTSKSLGTVEAGPGYRLLDLDETIKEGDQALSSRGEWFDVYGVTGGKVVGIMTAWRRKIPTPMPDPGEGYRLVREPLRMVCQDGVWLADTLAYVPTEQLRAELTSRYREVGTTTGRIWRAKDYMGEQEWHSPTSGKSGPMTASEVREATGRSAERCAKLQRVLAEEMMDRLDAKILAMFFGMTSEEFANMPGIPKFKASENFDPGAAPNRYFFPVVWRHLKDGDTIRVGDEEWFPQTGWTPVDSLVPRSGQKAWAGSGQYFRRREKFA